MQSLAFPGCSDLLSFKSHRFQAEQPRSILRLNLAADSSVRPSWAALPSPPMSGSPPRRDLIERQPQQQQQQQQQQLAGLRRKRSDSPPASPPASLPGQYSVSTSQVEPLSQTAAVIERQLNPASYFPTYPQAPSYGYGTGIPNSAPPTALQEIQTGYPHTSPRATRKVKAHVASACVNCKKKHLRCDSARPCMRCVQGGKESTCYDVEHRKRGRPPLKPEDPSTRSSFEHNTGRMPPQSQGHARRGSQPGLGTQNQPTSSPWRDIRPTVPRGYSDTGRSMFGPGPSFAPMYGQPTIAPGATMALGTMTPMDRPGYQVQTTPAQQSYPIQSQVGYVASPYEVYPQPQVQQRNYPAYLSQQQQQQQYNQSQQQAYAYPSYQRPAAAPPVPEEGPVGLYGSSSLQLPPIRPAPQGQVVEPAIAQQQRQAQPQGQYYPIEQRPDQASSDRPDPKRPRMDIRGILGPRND